MCEPLVKKPRVLQGNVNWEDGRFSDWAVRLGSKVYALHAFTLARASTFFESHIEMIYCSTASLEFPRKRESNITHVLPETCHGVFEDVLRFIYCEDKSDFEVESSKAVRILKVAEILGIPRLIQQITEYHPTDCLESLEEYLTIHVDGTDDGCALQEYYDDMVSRLRCEFVYFSQDKVLAERLRRLPSKILRSIIEHDELCVPNEDVVVDFVVDTLLAMSNSDMSSATNKKLSVQDELLPQVRWYGVSEAKIDELIDVLAKDKANAELVLGRIWINFIHGYKSHCLSSRRNALPKDLDDMFVKRPRTPLRPEDLPDCGSHEFDFLCFCGSDLYSRTSFKCFKFAGEYEVNFQPEQCLDDFTFKCSLASPPADESGRHVTFRIHCKPRRTVFPQWHFKPMGIVVEAWRFSKNAYMPRPFDKAVECSFSSENDLHELEDFMPIKPSDADEDNDESIHDCITSMELAGFLHLRCIFDESDDFSIYEGLPNT